MICPFRINYTQITGDYNARVDYRYDECAGRNCMAWEPNAKYNSKTKEYEGDCRMFLLDRKVSGLISTHPA